MQHGFLVHADTHRRRRRRALHHRARPAPARQGGGCRRGFRQRRLGKSVWRERLGQFSFAQTAALAVVFFLTTFVLAYLVTHKPRVGGGVMDTVKEQPQPAQQQQGPASQTAPDPAKASDAAKSKANEVPK